MAVYGLNNIKLSDVRTTLGETSYNLSTLCKSANNNKWSFYRGKKIRPNTTTKLVELYDDGGPYRLGDYRYYDHIATGPEPFNSLGSTLRWGPGGGTTDDLAALVNLESLNVKELGLNGGVAVDWMNIDLYSSSSDRASQLNLRHRETIAIDYAAVTNPINHSVDLAGITVRPDAPQLCQLTAVPTTWTTLYADTYLVDSGGTLRCRFDDSYSQFSISEYQSPIIKSTQLQNTPTGNSPNGSSWNAAFIITLATSTFPASAVDVTQTFGGTTYTFYTYILGTSGANTYALGVTNCKLFMSGKGSTFEIFDGALAYNAATLVTGTLPASGTWQYDDIGYIESDIVAGDYNGSTTLIS